MKIIEHLSDVAQGKTSISKPRSSKWPSVRKKHLESNPACAVCGGTEKVEVHHVRPFHLHPELELDLSNLVTLCESGKGGMNCHLAIGHLGSFKSFNADIETDAATWSAKIKARPSGD